LIDVHFALRINSLCRYTELRKLIPHGSLSHPREIRNAVFNVDHWHDIVYSSAPRLLQVNKFKNKI